MTFSNLIKYVDYLNITLIMLKIYTVLNVHIWENQITYLVTEHFADKFWDLCNSLIKKRFTNIIHVALYFSPNIFVVANLLS